MSVPVVGAHHGERRTWIARCEDAVWTHHDQRECPLHTPQSVCHGSRQRVLFGHRNQVNNDFGIAVGLKNRALAFEPGAQFLGIYQISIVRQPHHSLVRLHANRLRVKKG